MRRKIYISVLAALFSFTGWAQYAWYPVGSGTDLSVQSLAADTNNNYLYVGGLFSNAGSAPAAGIARWDGANYSPLGSGIVSGVGISALYVENNGDVIAGGTFTDIGGTFAKNIARWDGANWNALGSGLDVSVGIASVKTVARYNGDLYAGGTFTQSGSATINYIARWDGAAWQPVGGGTNGTVSALCVFGNELYAGGSFTSAGSTAVNNIAKWDGNAWTDVGGGVNYTGAISVSALQVYNGDLYAGGSFDSAGGTAVNHIARWDGGSWSDVGGGASYTGAISVSALEVFNGDLTVGGSFDSLGSISAYYVGRWNGSSWNPMNLGMNAPVNSLKAMKDTLYAGGNFTTADGQVAMFVAQWKSIGTSLAVAGAGDNTFALYPNPTAGKIRIEHNFKDDNLRFSLFDAPGREVFRQERVDGEISFEGKNIAPGLYLFKLYGSDNTVLEQGRLVLIR